MSPALLEEVVREPRLADPGLADELDQRPEACAHGRHRGRKHGALPLAADEWELCSAAAGTWASTPRTA
jgi:hypothetical protein